jgi:hypothetical protein
MPELQPLAILGDQRLRQASCVVARTDQIWLGGCSSHGTVFTAGAISTAAVKKVDQ